MATIIDVSDRQGASRYVGRFAPSPSGPLHFGSLVAALASYLDARNRGGQWLLRIEDLDPPRESPEAPAHIMSQLRAHGLRWDGDVLFQSTRLHAYGESLEVLRETHAVFPCTCTRKSLSGRYPGTCRTRSYSDTDPPFSERLRTTHDVVSFSDLVFGLQNCDVEKQSGDFIVKRKDGLVAYQLAVTVDDAFQGITHVIRGSDLLDSTARQILLSQRLYLPTMTYGHVPLVVDQQGNKLSKQTQAPPIDTKAPIPTLQRALAALGQNTQADASSVSQLVERATDAWRRPTIPMTPFTC